MLANSNVTSRMKENFVATAERNCGLGLHNDIEGPYLSLLALDAVAGFGARALEGQTCMCSENNKAPCAAL